MADNKLSRLSVHWRGGRLGLQEVVTMKKHLLVVALIAMVVLIAVPASAYSTEATYAVAANADDATIAVHQITFKNLSVGKYATKFDYTTDKLQCKNGVAIPSGSYSSYIWEDATKIGNFTATWTLTCAATYPNHSGNLAITYNINDLSTATTSSHMLKFTNTSGGQEFYDYIFGGWGGQSFYDPAVHTSDFTGISSDWAVGSADSGTHIASGTYNVYTGSAVSTPVASFSCTPTSQYPDTDVVCTDSSTNTPTDWYWTIDAESWGYDNWQTSTSQNFSWQSSYPGIFSVNLRANNSAGSDWENKSSYVFISENATPNNCDIAPQTGYTRTYAQTNDGMTSGGIFNSDIQMKDVEGSAWSNVTNSGGWWCIDTLPGHSLNLYAQATGYTDVESIGVSANGGRHYLVMWPDYIPAPSAGNTTLYALVYDQQTGTPLYLSTVRVDGNTINTVMKNTGPEGQAMFTIKNDTAIHVTASKTGYTSITKVLTTSHLGPDTIMISLPRASVTATATATATPSWMTPSTTVDPRTSTEKDSDMMDLIRDNGEALIGLAIITTMLGLMKMWGK